MEKQNVFAGAIISGATRSVHLMWSRGTNTATGKIRSTKTGTAKAKYETLAFPCVFTWRGLRELRAVDIS